MAPQGKLLGQPLLLSVPHFASIVPNDPSLGRRCVLDESMQKLMLTPLVSIGVRVRQLHGQRQQCQASFTRLSDLQVFGRISRNDLRRVHPPYKQRPSRL